jgi:hypothetical protein
MEVSGQLHPSHFTPGDRTAGVYLIGGWVDPRVNLDAVEKKENFFLDWDSLSGISAIQPIACHYSN